VRPLTRKLTGTQFSREDTHGKAAYTGRVRTFSGFSKAKKALDEQLPGLKPWTLHDLRRTFSTNLAKLGVLPHIKEMLLNHVSAKTEVEAIYDTYKHLPEMREAMQKWETHFSALLIVPPNGVGFSPAPGLSSTRTAQLPSGSARDEIVIEEAA
jgi:hypothetical protein